MDIEKQHIAVLCDYKLMPERIGGMDHFFWAFQKACDEEGIVVDWFFPDTTAIENYCNFNIVPANGTIEQTFLNHLKKTANTYTHIFTHFLELCTPFYKKVKAISKAQIIAVDHNPRPLVGYRLEKRLKKRIKGHLYSRYIDVFVGVSEYTSKEIVKDFGGHLQPKVKTIYNGVVIDDILPRTNSDYTISKFLVVSHLRYSKGIQDLISAVAGLPQREKSMCKIDIFGEGPYEMELKQLCQRSNVSQNFNFKGSIDNLNAIYKNYDYLLQPTHMECFSLSILESLAANVQVITTPVGGNTEVIEHGVNGIILPAKDVKVWTNCIENIIRNTQRVHKETRSLIEARFSVYSMVLNYIDLMT